MRRAGLVAAAAVLTVAAVLGVLAFFNARDDATFGDDGAPAAPGRPAPQATAPELRRGNVVLRYGDPAHAATLRRMAAEFGPESLAGAGQAVLVRRDPGTRGVVAEAWRRRLQASSPDDPALREFAEYWLGRGAMP
ncbi:MAG TPA: DUF3105 domain-containing protein [Solirubrobacteraceae bacterium]|nr:DUF3105 domain-containing protein [Solirubrobacteraceae bacterium]